jgi:hypothetical protein
MTDVVVETLRLRGPGAPRLARVAAAALPAALDRALADVADARIDRLDVPLALDLDADDETLATLWADAIRARVLERVGRRTPPPRPGPAAAPALPAPRVGPREARAAAEAWLAHRRPRGDLPLAALALATAGTGDQPARDLLLMRLDEAVAAAVRMPSRPAPHRPSADRPATITDGAAADRRPAAVGSAGPADAALPHLDAPPAGPPNPATTPGAEPGSGPASGQARLAAARTRLAALADLVAGSTSPRLTLPLELVTRAAGLFLLYPWLADHCRRAVDLHPGADETEVRARALAAVVDPGDLGLVADPLVALLAGIRPGGISAPAVPLPRQAEVDAEAGRVLASFAALLPGFGASSAPFVRREWIRRAGLVDPELDPVRVEVVSHPLDVVLPALPYPYSLVKLPWSPVLAARWRP